MRFNVLAISGSPRKGNSEYLLERALEGVEDARLPGVAGKKEYPLEIFRYSFRGKHFEPCIGCNHCIRKKGACVHDDDFEELKLRWLEADVVIYSVPVYHMTYPAQVKCFLDRLGQTMFGMSAVKAADGTETLPKLFKVIASIAQGIHIFSGQEHTLTDFINHALVMQSIPVTGDMWEAYIGAGGWTLNRGGRDSMETLFDTGDKSVEAAVRACRSLGKRAVETAAIVKAGLLAQRAELKDDPLYGWIYRKLDTE